MSSYSYRPTLVTYLNNKYTYIIIYLKIFIHTTKFTSNDSTMTTMTIQCVNSNWQLCEKKWTNWIQKKCAVNIHSDEWRLKYIYTAESHIICDVVNNLKHCEFVFFKSVYGVSQILIEKKKLNTQLALNGTTS